MINFSIIIPHKNIPNLLQRCLDSIPKRDDLEILVIDDNSDPNIVDFSFFPGKNRKNVTIILDKKGRGGGYARNLGLEIVKGRWLLFADADDFFHKGFNDILNKYLDSNSDLIFFDADCVNTDTLKPSKKNRAQHLNNYILEYKKNKANGELNLRYLFGEPWAKIISTELIKKNQIKFEETIIHNDTAFSYKIGFFAAKIDVDSSVVYCITDRTNSVSKKVDSERILTRIAVFSRANKFYEDHSIDVYSAFLYRQLADLYLSNRALYQQGLAIAKGNGLNIKAVKRKILKEIPKAIGRKYIKG